MNKTNAKLWKEIQNNIYPDPFKTHEAMYKLVAHSLQQAREDNDKKWKDKIEGIMFMYEHQRIGKNKEALCEVCREVVTDRTPCKASGYYTTWLALSDLLTKEEL